MLANKRFVKDTMYGMVPEHFKAPGWDRRYWCDKAADPARRNLAFKFGSAEQAELAAEVLRGVLKVAGYANTVRVTHTDMDSIRRFWGGHYVRVQVLMD